jgi:hypothetical protein
MSDDVQRVTRSLVSYPDYRNATPEQRAKLLDLAVAGRLQICASGIIRGINSIKENTH